MLSEGRSFGLLVDLPHEAVAGASRHPSQRGSFAALFTALFGGLRRWFA